MTDPTSAPIKNPRPKVIHSLDTMRDLPLRDVTVQSGVDLFDLTYDTHIWALITSVYHEEGTEFANLHTCFVSLPRPEAEWMAAEIGTTVGSGEFVEEMRFEIKDGHWQMWPQLRPGTVLDHAQVDVLLNQMIIPRIKPTSIRNLDAGLVPDVVSDPNGRVPTSDKE